jgi:hypothetical protein
LDVLTESSARHPLFEGVHTVHVSSIPREPVVTRAGDVVRLEMDGIRLEFRHARVNRGERVIQFNVGGSGPGPTKAGQARWKCFGPLQAGAVAIILSTRRIVLRICRREPHYR